MQNMLCRWLLIYVLYELKQLLKSDITLILVYQIIQQKLKEFYS